MINIAVCNNRKDKKYTNHKIPFKNLIEKLSKTNYTNETYNDYLNFEKEKQDNIKDIGGFVGGYLKDGKRSKSTVAYRNLLTLDVDYGYKGIMDYIEITLPFSCIIYNTHKHNSENERFRIVMPLSENVDSIQYEAISRLIANELGIDYFDDTTYDPSRLMYFPSTSKDGEFKFMYREEDYLDVKKYLNMYSDYKDKSKWPKYLRTNKITSLDKDKQQNPLDKEEIIGTFCRTCNIYEVIEKYLSDIYLPTDDKTDIHIKKEALMVDL